MRFTTIPLGLWFLEAPVNFYWTPSSREVRGVFPVSIDYIPLLIFFIAVDRFVYVLPSGDILLRKSFSNSVTANGMKRKITDYHRDDDGDWVAHLACGHQRHVRHDPPWIRRCWVTTPEGRERFLGRKIDCGICSMEANRNRS